MCKVCKYLILLTFISPQVAIADVTLRLATPKPSLDFTFEYPLESVELSAAQIDQITGTSAFSSLTDGLFLDLAQFRIALRSEIIAALLSNSSIKSVQSVNVEADTLSGRLDLGLSSTIPTALSGISAVIQARADGPIPLLCSSVTFTARLDASATGNFDVVSGFLSEIAVVTDVEVLSASCSGLLSFIGGLFNSEIRDIVDSKIESEARNFLGMDSISTFLGVENIAIGFNLASIIQGDIAQKVQLVLTHFLLNTNGSFLRLDIELRSNFFGNGEHSLVLIASNGKAPNIAFAEVRRIGLGIRGLRIDFNAGNSPEVNIFARRPGAVAWTPLATTTTSPLIVPFSSLDDPEWPAGSEVMMISENFLVPGLMSFPVTELVTDPEAEARAGR